MAIGSLKVVQILLDFVHFFVDDGEHFCVGLLKVSRLDINLTVVGVRDLLFTLLDVDCLALW